MRRYRRRAPLRSRRRRTYKKRRRTSRRSRRIPRLLPLGGIPKIMDVTLKYAAIEEMAAATGFTYCTRVYRGNSIYDPDYSGVTQNTCAMYGVWSNLYRYYTVKSSFIKVTFQATQNVPHWCFITPYFIAGSTPVAPDDWMDLPGVKKGLLQGLSAGNKTSVIIKMSGRTKTITGQSPYISDLTGMMGGNPLIQWFWYLAMETFDGSTTGGGLINVELFYKVRFSERLMYTGY